MSDGSGPARASYRFGPRDRGGVVAGLRAGQLVPAGLSVVAALAALRSLRPPLGAAAAVVLLVAVLPATVLPVGGRTLGEWLVLGVSFAWRRSAFEKPLASARGGVAPSAAGGVRGAGNRLAARPPAAFRHLSVVELDCGDGRLGAVHDLRRGSFTGVLALAADGFALLPAAERARRVAGWSGVLAAVAQQPGGLSRLAWIERTVPDDGTVWRRRAGEAVGGAASASYCRLVEAEISGLARHELLLACTIGLPVPGFSWAGGRRLAASEAGDRLATELARIGRRCATAGLGTDGVLDAVELGELIRRSFAGGAGPPSTSSWPWPLAVAEEWGTLRTDASWHASYWISEWPRSEVGDDFLLPLLVGSWARRAVALVMTPRPPLRAMRAAEQARTEHVAEAELRQRHGFAVTARHRLTGDAVERRERELAAGHGAYHFSGFVTVSAAERAELAEACQAVEQAAALSHLELRRLFGAQAEAFCCTLPAGRGSS